MANPNPLTPTSSALPSISGIALKDLMLIRPFRVNIIPETQIQEASIVSSASIAAGIREGHVLFIQLLMTERDPNHHKMAFLFTEMHRFATEKTIAALEEDVLKRQLHVIDEHLKSVPDSEDVVPRRALNQALAAALQTIVSFCDAMIERHYKRYLAQFLSYVTDDHAVHFFGKKYVPFKGCALLPLSEAPKIEDLKSAIKNHYIIAGETLWYFDHIASTLQPLAFLDTKTLASLADRLRLVSERDATKEELRLITSYTGHTHIEVVPEGTYPLAALEAKVQRDINDFLDKFTAASTFFFKTSPTKKALKIVMDTLVQRKTAASRRLNETTAAYEKTVIKVEMRHQENRSRYKHIQTLAKQLKKEAPPLFICQLHNANIQERNPLFIQKLSAVLSQRKFGPLEKMASGEETYLHYAVRQRQMSIVRLFLDDCVEQGLNPLLFSEPSAFRTTLSSTGENILHLLANMAHEADTADKIRWVCTILEATIEAAVAVTRQETSDLSVSASENEIQKMLQEAFFQSNHAKKIPLLLFLGANRFQIYMSLKKYLTPSFTSLCPLEKEVYERLHSYEVRFRQLEARKIEVAHVKELLQQCNDEPINNTVESRMLHQRKLIEALWLSLWASNHLRQATILTEQIRRLSKKHAYVDPLTVGTSMMTNELVDSLKKLSAAYSAAEIEGHFHAEFGDVEETKEEPRSDESIVLKRTTSSTLTLQKTVFDAIQLSVAFKVQNILCGKIHYDVKEYLSVPAMSSFACSFHAELYHKVLVPSAQIAQQSWLKRIVSGYPKQDVEKLRHYQSRFNFAFQVIEKELIPLSKRTESNYALQLDLISTCLYTALNRMSVELRKKQEAAKEVFAKAAAFSACTLMAEPLKQVGEGLVEVMVCSSNTATIYQEAERYKEELKMANEGKQKAEEEATIAKSEAATAKSETATAKSEAAIAKSEAAIAQSEMEMFRIRTITAETDAAAAKEELRKMKEYIATHLVSMTQSTLAAERIASTAILSMPPTVAPDTTLEPAPDKGMAMSVQAVTQQGMFTPTGPLAVSCLGREDDVKPMPTTETV